MCKLEGVQMQKYAADLMITAAKNVDVIWNMYLLNGQVQHL